MFLINSPEFTLDGGKKVFLYSNIWAGNETYFSIFPCLLISLLLLLMKLVRAGMVLTRLYKFSTYSLFHDVLLKENMLVLFHFLQ